MFEELHHFLHPKITSDQKVEIGPSAISCLLIFSFFPSRMMCHPKSDQMGGFCKAFQL